MCSDVTSVYFFQIKVVGFLLSLIGACPSSLTQPLRKLKDAKMNIKIVVFMCDKVLLR